ncbi:hypothetical protein H2198_002686 [Neophaeococcomyces mojaviensis]|uniref:Uncharacterized protein n=1 Tax=Neophaeococcomyces mojaviensis TaxID=3383035 RepID=A0ACC3ADD7_9EURO|nr:hypothetical protein H2198_002686 [Knufia sp. JES_112]
MLSSLPSFRRQQLLLEYATIKSKCPGGIYLSPSPADVSTWIGTLFVRDGPYSSAILRFEIVFPSSYPDTGPLVNFFTEIFHPLLVPLTTYTFAAGALDPNVTFSAADTKRLPPGSFNLHEAFPLWYESEQDKRSARSSSIGSAAAAATARPISIHSLSAGIKQAVQTDDTRPVLLDVLKYVKRAFEDETLLDNLPLRAAVSPNAWHAWRAYRGLPKLGSRSISPASAESERTPLSPGRDPGDWNWDGVWESRVRGGIEESISDASLFSSKGGRVGNVVGGSIRFAKHDDEKTEEIQHLMLRTLGVMPSD